MKRLVGLYRYLLLANLVSVMLLSVQAEISAQEKSVEQPVEPISLFNGKDLKGLRILKKAYFEDHGKIAVQKGELLIGKGLPGSGIAVDPKIHSKLPRMNYEVTIEAKRNEGTDFFCGLTFPVDKNYCSFILGGWGGGAFGLSNLDGMSAIENESTGFHEFENGVWYRIRLRVTDKLISGFLLPLPAKKIKGEEAKKLTEKKLFDIKTKQHKFDIWWEQEPARPLGIATWSTSTSIRKFEIQRIIKPAEKKK